jgi:hypothetical protein
MASPAVQPTAAPQDRSSNAASDQWVTGREWFASGARRPCDSIAKVRLETAAGKGSTRPLRVFEAVVAAPRVGA